MPTTGLPWELPYPVPGDHTRTWEYWQALAEKTAQQLTAVKAQIPPIKTGSFSQVLTTGTSWTIAVTFPVPAFAIAPQVMVTPYTPVSVIANRLAYRALSITTAGFTISIVVVDNVSATSPTVLGGWHAIANPATFPTMAAQSAPDDWHDAKLTCHTDGCDNADSPIPVLIPDQPEPGGWLAQCGVCGLLIEDVRR